MAALYLISITSKAAIFLTILYKITHKIRCKMMGGLCFMIAVCSVIEFYKRVFHAFVGFFLMDCASNLKHFLTNSDDFGSGFFIFGCCSRFFNVIVLFFVFLLGFKFLQFSGHNKGKNQMMSNDNDDEFNGVKNSSFRSGTTRDLCKTCGDQKFDEINEVLSAKFGVKSEVDDEEEEECGTEDEMFDVMTLRKMVKVARRKAIAARNDLEKERMAASSSVDEAMAMILRLQGEKSSLQIRVNQLERAAEEKQAHDHEVIQSMQWMIMKHESERSLLEDQLRLCREKLRVFVKGEEWDQFDSVCPTPSAVSHSSFESRDNNDVVIGSIDFDLSPM